MAMCAVWSDAEVEAALLATRPTVRGIAWRILRDPEEVADAEQEVCLAVWKSRRTIRGQSLRAFIAAVAANTCLNLRARSKGIAAAVVREADGATAGQSLDDAPDSTCLADLAEHRETAEQLAAAMERISGEHRRIIELHLACPSYRAAAERLGIREEAFKLRLHRARRSLREWRRQDY